MMPPRDELKNTLDALERLLNMFRAERYLYLGLTAASFLILLIFGFQLVTKGEPSEQMLVTVFGGAGLVAASSARISWFFNRAFSIIERLITGVSNVK